MVVEKLDIVEINLKTDNLLGDISQRIYGGLKKTLRKHYSIRKSHLKFEPTIYLSYEQDRKKTL